MRTKQLATVTSKSGRVLRVRARGSAGVGYWGELIARNGVVVAETVRVPFRDAVFGFAVRLAATI